jgi:hypothetical protein
MDKLEIKRLFLDSSICDMELPLQINCIDVDVQPSILAPNLNLSFVQNTTEDLI